VVYDGSAAARRGLLEAASQIEEHDAALTVVAPVVHERRAVGCCVPSMSNCPRRGRFSAPTVGPRTSPR